MYLIPAGYLEGSGKGSLIGGKLEEVLSSSLLLGYLLYLWKKAESMSDAVSSGGTKRRRSTCEFKLASVSV